MGKGKSKGKGKGRGNDKNKGAGEGKSTSYVYDRKYDVPWRFLPPHPPSIRFRCPPSSILRSCVASKRDTRPIYLTRTMNTAQCRLHVTRPTVF